MYELINSLQESEDYYYIDYIPYTTYDSEYLELEEYFIKTYLESFSKKISRIMLKLIYYYPCEIYLTEPSRRKIPNDFNFFFNTNIRKNTPDRLSYAIRQIILNDFSSINILFTEPIFLITIEGEFAVTIYNAPDKSVQLLNQLVQQEGLFLKKHN